MYNIPVHSQPIPFLYKDILPGYYLRPHPLTDHMMYTMTVRMASRQGSRPKAAVQRAGSVVNGQIGRYTLNPSTRDKWKS